MKEKTFPHIRKPVHGQRQRVAEGGNFGDTEESAATMVRGASREIPAQRISANQQSPAQEACLLINQGGWGLGAEA